MPLLRQLRQPVDVTEEQAGDVRTLKGWQCRSTKHWKQVQKGNQVNLKLCSLCLVCRAALSQQKAQIWYTTHIPIAHTTTSLG